MHVVSLTGRPWHEFDRALIEGQEKIGVLTDREHTPATIAERMLRYGYDNYIIYVGEALGSDTETIRVLVPDDAKALTFRHPNCLFSTARTSGSGISAFPKAISNCSTDVST